MLAYSTPLQGATASGGSAPPLYPDSDTSQAVRLLWTSDQPGAETSTLQHTSLT